MGVDVYFENVDGRVFEAVLPLFNQDARITICGLIARYGDEDWRRRQPRGGDELGELIFKAR